MHVAQGMVIGLVHLDEHVRQETTSFAPSIPVLRGEG